MTPCLFSATHWYMPASDRVSADTDRTPSSTWILSCEEKVERKQLFSLHLQVAFAFCGALWQVLDLFRGAVNGRGSNQDAVAK